MRERHDFSDRVGRLLPLGPMGSFVRTIAVAFALFVQSVRKTDRRQPAHAAELGATSDAANRTGTGLALPYTFIMPDPLVHDEWLSLGDDEPARLRALGLEVRHLPGESVIRAQTYFNRNRKLGLKLNDCFALVLAEDTEESILLTGDARLRELASNNGVEVHGVLWITDEMETHGIATPRRLHDALCLLRDDDLVFLPMDELARRIRRLARLL